MEIFKVAVCILFLFTISTGKDLRTEDNSLDSSSLGVSKLTECGVRENFYFISRSGFDDIEKT